MIELERNNISENSKGVRVFLVPRKVQEAREAAELAKIGVKGPT